MRTLNTQLAAYTAEHDGHFPASLNDLPDLEMAFVNGAKNIYEFIYRPASPGDKGYITSYAVVANPLEYGEAADVSFFTTQAGVIYWTREDREATVKDDPLDTLSFD